MFIIPASFFKLQNMLFGRFSKQRFNGRFEICLKTYFLKDDSAPLLDQSFCEPWI